MPEPMDLSSHECEQLLRAGVAGRVAVSTPSGPHIIPVNYSVVDDTIVMRTSAYSVLGTFGRDTTLAFEIDLFDYEYQHGWSVVVRGRAEFLVDQSQIDHIRSVWAPRPWASGSRGVYIRLPWTELTGRRLGTGWDTLSQSPVRRNLGPT